jgi:hypothetical protein
MKTRIAMALFGLGIGLASAPVASATDMSFGADALYQQLAAASEVALATAGETRDDVQLFATVYGLKGNIALEFTLEPYQAADAVSFRTGVTYLLFMKRASPRSNADYQLALGGVSAQPVRSSDEAAYRQAIGTYLDAAGDLDRLKGALFQLALSRSAYLQYSAVADLKHLNLIERAELAQLVDMLSSNQLTEPRARGIVVRQIARLQAREYTGLLESLVRSSTENVSVKVDAIDTLDSIGATASLRALVPALEAEPSLRLRGRVTRIRDSQGTN